MLFSPLPFGSRWVGCLRGLYSLPLPCYTGISYAPTRRTMQVQVSLTIEIGASASLTQMEQQIQEAGRQAMREALKQAIRQGEDQTVTCPHCGQKQRRVEGTTRRVIATTFGRVTVPRRRFRCQGCGRRWCPATSLFNELKGGTISQPRPRSGHAGRLLLALSSGEPPAQATQWSANQCGRDPSADQPGWPATSGAAARGGRADMLYSVQRGSSSTAGRATDAGGVGWWLGV